ncbi:hypothetical protein J5X84_26555 [Streptosporangiaceae bacterium NEAU-GS5]|nr:hypothetical protein [Streptosporangiaceae bacterium NEAU-GS5]
MRRRSLAFVLAAALVSASCGTSDTYVGSSTGTASATPMGSAMTSDGRPVAVWRLDGGFTPPGVQAIRPPRVVVYGDGQVIADAAHTLQLSPAEFADLMAALGKDLAGQPATVTPSPGTPAVADAPTTVLGVRAGDGPIHEVSIGALDQTMGGYSAEILDARDRMGRLADRVTAEGQAYTSPRVRLVAEDVPGAEGTIHPWPEGVPEPPATSAPVRVSDLSDAAAETVARMVPRDPEQPFSWPTFRAPSGASLNVSWRYLMPGEQGATG